MRFVIVLLLMGTHAFAAPDDLDAQAVVERILARSEKIQSGVFEVSVTTRTFNLPSNAPRFRVIVEDKGAESERRRIGFLDNAPSDEFPHYRLTDLVLADESNELRKITVAGDEWVARNPAIPSTEIGKSEFAATYTERTHDTGEIQRNLLIEPSYNGLTHSDDGLRWRQFLQCGTVPGLIYDFISNRRRPDGIQKNGDLIEVFWQLSQPELNDIFDKSTPVFLYVGEKSILSLTTVPSQGYVLPEVHFLSQDLHKQVSFISTGFTDAGNGVFFPTRCEYSCVSPLNLEQTIYDIDSASGINDPPPPDTFELTLEPGTRVRNTLPGYESVFTVGDSTGTTSISGALNYIPEEYSPTASDTDQTIVLSVSIGIGLLLVVTILVYARNIKKNSTV